MKLNKIKRLCLESKRFNIIDSTDGVQWFTDNRSMWLCVGIVIERGALPELFGLNSKQCEKCLFLGEKRAGEEYGIAMAETEPMLDYMGDVWEFEQRLMALRGEDGMLYVPRAFADACHIERDTTFTVRTLPDAEGEYSIPMVAVYNGMICEALLKPIEASWAKCVGERLAKLGEIPPYILDKKLDAAG